MSAVEQIRAFVRRTDGKVKMTGADDLPIGGFPELTRRNLRTLVIMAEAYQAEHPHLAAAIEHGGCTKECFHLRA